MDRVVIVGASVAGLTAAEVLRRDGFKGDLTLIGDETHPPYDRPPLSKQVLRGAWEPHRVHLRDDQALEKLGARWRLGVRATGLDLDGRRLTTSDGDEVEYDGLVIATGVTPRRLPCGHEMSGVHLLRTIDDATSIRGALASDPVVVVIGAGFLGAEVAAVVREMDIDVTVVDPLDAPMVRQFGREIGGIFADLHRARGVRLMLAAEVAGLTEFNDRVSGVRLGSGVELRADLVVVAIGARPNVDWLTQSGLSLTNGIDCDASGLAAPGVVAAGDVANWYSPRLGSRLRVEHRMNATEQGATAARTLLGIRRAVEPVHFFWTDQYDVRVQAYGMPTDDAELEMVAGEPGTGKFAATYSRDGTVVGVVAWNMPGEARKLRHLLVEEELP